MRAITMDSGAFKGPSDASTGELVQSEHYLGERRRFSSMIKANV